MSLIDRNDTMADLEDLLAYATQGKGRVALVSGAVATGKTEVLQAFGEAAFEFGALTVSASGSRVERELPFGVIGQLLRDAPLVDQDRERALALLDEGGNAMLTAQREGDDFPELDAHLVHSVCTVLIELAQRCPLVITVDDVHHVDRASLLCLAYLGRRARFAPVLLVLSHCEPGRSSDAFILGELSRQPHCRRLRLPLLSREGVSSLIAERLGQETAEESADSWYAVSGGNPLLAASLVEDYEDYVRASGGEPPSGFVIGVKYGEAVVSCLRRGEPYTLKVARALAVLDTAQALPKLVGGDVQRALHTLTLAGLLERDRFRHPEARAAVLAEVSVNERMELQRSAAVLAYEQGAAPSVVAGHLVEASRVEADWVVPVLEDAARDALREGLVDAAVSYLRLAWRECPDGQHKTRIATMLVRAEWRINPGAPATHLAELAGALRRDSLRGADAVVLTRALLWHGRFDDARDVLTRLSESAEADTQEAQAELAILQPWLRATHPAFLAQARAGHAGSRAAITSVSASRRMDSAMTLADVLTRGPRERVLEAAQRMLQGVRLDEMSMETVENALLTMVYGGWAEKAASWCDVFSVEAAARRAPSRQARLAAIRAEIALRQGDLQDAAHHATTALEIIPASSWGVAVGGPLSSLIIAATAMGDLAVGDQQLDRPVPEAMFATRYGLHYLYARGRYGLAAGHPGLALRDFQRCGELMNAWELDVPGLLPWRVDAAEALVRLGRTEVAQQLVEAQLERCGSGSPREHGMAMRVLASLGEARHRPMLLRQAAELLQTGADRYELARAQFDLAEAYHALGEFRRAGMITGRAYTLAQGCHAEPLCTALSPKQPSGEVPERTVLAATLSDAEHRVAALAAAGFTNREIAAKLYITVSTVEQHLTRVYRKLDITRRADLPSGLDFGLATRS
ncbi:transcriptional regulator [Planobispora rosea]|uniref:Transcriptional regulator n=1 Tax=Planobispora rosea TaxID=35762 RepID=A0A8J3S738_PLARO|nr:AAA family ATPase [Planobispora rosea]GGT07076.1 transcriptional regulator [Planobispora rosea]GIH89152.1 transcriptional regulator [Planobispora rosea]